MEFRVHNGVKYAFHEGCPDAYMFGAEWAEWGKPHLADGAVALDIGAHVGVCTRWLSSVCRSVIAIEPNPISANLLRANIRAHSLDNVAVLECALSNKAGIVRFSLGDQGSHLDENGEVTVVLLTLDSLCLLPRVDFIKIDTEAEETRILDGGNELIRRHRPIILVEEHCALTGNYSTDGLSGIASRYGYDWAIVDQNECVKQWLLTPGESND